MPPLPLPAALPGSVILVADDDEGVRTLVCRVVAAQGLIPLAASDGVTALELSYAYEPYLVGAILDILMPRGNGVTIASMLRRHLRNVPIVLISGYAHFGPASPIARLPNVLFLQKPFPVARLEQLIQQMQERHPLT